MRIIFMGTPAFALPALQQLQASPKDEVVAVYSQPPRPAGRGHKETKSPTHQFAEEHHIPVETPISLKSVEAQEKFTNYQADIAVVAAYGLLLPKPILEACPLGCINIHPSLLPKYRGAAPLQRCIESGDSITGVTIMQMDVGLDTGPMILKETYTIPPGTNSGGLHDTLADCGAKLLMKVIDMARSSPLPLTPQPEQGASYAQKITKEEALLDFNQDAKTLYNKILAFQPFPGTYFMFQGEMIKVRACHYESKDMSAAPGTVMDDRLKIACKHGSITPSLLQRQGKAPMLTEALLRGFPIPKGTQLT